MKFQNVNKHKLPIVGGDQTILRSWHTMAACAVPETCSGPYWSTYDQNSWRVQSFLKTYFHFFKVSQTITIKFPNSQPHQIGHKCLKMYFAIAGCKNEHKSQFESYLTCSQQGQEMKHRPILNVIWPICPDLKSRFSLKLILITENAGQMLTWRVLGVMNPSLQFNFMNNL